MTDPLLFPPGVVRGLPFATAATAAAWLHSAATAGYPDVRWSVEWAAADVLEPVVSSVQSPVLPCEDLDSDQVRSAWIAYEDDDGPLPLDLPTWAEGFDLAGHIVQFAWTHHRTLTGLDYAWRSLLATTDDRATKRAAAWTLGHIERATARTADVVVAHANHYVTGIWKAALASGADVDPANPHTPTDPPPSGGYRLITP